MRDVDSPALTRPHVALLHDQPVVREPQQRRSRQRLDRAVGARHDGPPVDGGAVALDDGLTEPALRPGLVGERPLDVLAGGLPLPERVREEDGVVGVERGDPLDVLTRPRLLPDVCPATRGGLAVYFATSIARDSRITMTFTWPGYSS